MRTSERKQRARHLCGHAFDLCRVSIRGQSLNLRSKAVDEDLDVADLTRNFRPRRHEHARESRAVGIRLESSDDTLIARKD